MRKKCEKEPSKHSSKTAPNTPADATVTASTTAADTPPLPSVEEAFSKLVTPDPAPAATSPTKPTNGAGNGAAPGAKTCAGGGVRQRYDRCGGGALSGRRADRLRGD